MKTAIRIISDYGFSPLGGLGLHFYIYQDNKLIKHLFIKDRE
jgi:hypothetical protein